MNKKSVMLQDEEMIIRRKGDRRKMRRWEKKKIQKDEKENKKGRNKLIRQAYIGRRKNSFHTAWIGSYFIIQDITIPCLVMKETNTVCSFIQSLDMFCSVTDTWRSYTWWLIMQWIAAWPVWCLRQRNCFSSSDRILSRALWHVFSIWLALDGKREGCWMLMNHNILSPCSCSECTNFASCCSTKLYLGHS